MHLSQVASSIFASLGVADLLDEINCTPSPTGREVLFLVDGLGANVLSEYASEIPVLSRMQSKSPIRTAFPSTTASSLSTLMTGQLPGVHGMLGYTVRVPRSDGRILNALKWDERVDPEVWQPVTPLFQRAMEANVSVSHIAAKRYEGSGFTRAVFRGANYRGANVLRDMIMQTQLALTNPPAFAYVYINELDVAGHTFGVGSDEWITALKYVDSVARELITQLPVGTRIWLTADHGMVNVEEKEVLGEGNHLLTEIGTIAGEPRARHLYLSAAEPSPAQIDDVAGAWRTHFANRAEVHTRSSAIEAGLFGAEVSADASERMGDLIVIPAKNLILIDPERVDKESAMVGHHGALTEAEVNVPLLMTSAT